jgi:HK97 family phage portal protein
MGRHKGSLNKKTIENKNIIDINNMEIKAMPPNFGSPQAFIIPPRALANDAPSILKLYTNYTAICIDKIADTITSLPLHMYVTKSNTSLKSVWQTKRLTQSHQNIIKKNSNTLRVKQAEEIEEIVEHSLWDVLDNVNNDLSWNDLIKLVIQYLMMTGNAYIYIKKDGKTPIGLEVLPAEYTSVMLDTQEMNLVGYRTFNGFNETIYDKNDVLHLKFVAPGMFWRLNQNGKLLTGVYGMGRAEKILSIIMLSNAIDDAQRAMVENMAIPAGVLTYKEGALTPEQIKSAESSWKKSLGGLKRIDGIKVLDGNWDFKALSLPPKDMEYKEARQWCREVIANAFGVPVGFFSSDNANRATSLTDLSNFMSFTIAPLTKMISEKLNKHLVKQFDDNLFVEFENPVKSDNEFLMKQEMQRVDQGITTINEVRNELGREPVEWGDSPLGNLTTHVTDKGELDSANPNNAKEKHDMNEDHGADINIDPDNN